MTVKKTASVISLLFFILVFPFFAANAQVLSDKEKRPVLDKLRSLQVPFIENRGQIEDPSVKYYARTFGGAVFITHDGRIVYSLPNNEKSTRTIEESFVGAFATSVIGEEHAATNVNYFRGSDPSRWKTDIPSYNSVNLGEVYPQIELRLKAYGNNVEKLFLVKPGGDPGMIKIKLEGVGARRAVPLPSEGRDGLSVNDQGELEIETESGIVRFTKPVAYQELDDVKKHVDVAYVLKDDEYGFSVGDYDPSRELVIDPLLASSTFIGGSNAEAASSIVVDGYGNVYVTGVTTSTDFPTTPGAFDSTCGTDSNCNYDIYGILYQDIFVSKLNVAGSAVVYTTYLGGSGHEYSLGIAVDAHGNAYITGYTGSVDFPTTPGSFRATSPYSMWNLFVTKLNADGSSLVYSALFGGGSDVGSAIAVDAHGNAYITGYTWSGFPTTEGAFQSAPGGNGDAFVAKLNAAGSALIYFTYLGGFGIDEGHGIAVDVEGNAYVTGSTSSKCLVPPDPFNPAGWSEEQEEECARNRYNQAFPITPGAFQTRHSDADENVIHSDVFVTKLNSTGSALVYSTYLGGDDHHDVANAIAVDVDGNAYVTGYTMSFDFPITAAAFQPAFGGGWADAFVTKLNTTGSVLVYSTFLGSFDDDGAFSIAVDSHGNAYVTGGTGGTGPWGTFPTANSLQPAFGGGAYDGFVTKLNTTGAALVYSTLLGGNGDDGGFSITVDNAGNAYVAGGTSSIDFRTTAGAFQTSLKGLTDAFLVKISTHNPTVLVFPVSHDFGNVIASLTSVYTFTITNTGTVNLVVGPISIIGADTSQFGLRSDTCSGEIIGPSATCTFEVRFSPTSAGTKIANISISSNAANEPTFIVPLTGIGVIQSFSLTVTLQGTESGRVTSDPAGIDCGNDCTENYISGTSTTLTASTASGWSFSSWSGCDTVSGATCNVTMNSDRAITATFMQLIYAFTVSKSGSGTVASSPGGINCEGDCAEDYVSGTSITLTATPATGWSFIGWSGCDSASGSSCYLTVDSIKTVTAIFAQPTSTMTITSISPSLGTTAGGCPISVTGTGFQSGSMLFIGNMLSEQISVSSDTLMTAITPHGTAPEGSSPVPTAAVVALNGQSSDPAIDQVTFTYVHPGDIRDSQGIFGNHDGRVSIAEVQSVINMFLTDLDIRPEADSDCDGLIGINEVQQAINSFLSLP